jgi:hypothetical protein
MLLDSIVLGFKAFLARRILPQMCALFRERFAWSLMTVAAGKKLLDLIARPLNPFLPRAALAVALRHADNLLRNP